MRTFIIALFVITSLSTFANDCQNRWKNLFPKSIDSRYTTLLNKCDGELKSAIAKLISTNTNDNYDSARMAMYKMDTNEYSEICSVYNTKCVKYKSGNPRDFNTEHTWPQSKGAKGIARADIHHLYTSDSKTNSMRSNLPFCEVHNTSKGSNTPTETNSAVGTDLNGRPCFEPKGEHKGEVARAMFYFSVRYNMGIDERQEAFLKEWNDRDVTEFEANRNDRIEEFQHNRNPFVDYPELTLLISDF